METKVVFDEKETRVKMTLAYCDGGLYREEDFHGMPIKLGQWFGLANCYGNMHVPIVIRGYERGGLLRVQTYTKGAWRYAQWVDMKYVEVEVMNYLISNLTEDERYLLPEFAGGMSSKEREQFEDNAYKIMEDDPDSERADALWKLIYRGR